MRDSTRYLGEPDLLSGLILLTGSHSTTFAAYDDAIVNSTQLPTHPFALDMPGEEWKHHEGVLLLAYHGVTDQSVKRMRSCITHFIATYCESAYPLRLREIRVGTPGRRSVFFEAWMNGNVLIAGGCTDCSGTGGQGTVDMRAMFALVSKFFDVKHEVVEISATEGRVFYEEQNWQFFE